MIEEFSRYDLIPHYHKMFELDGVSDDIKMAKLALSNSAEVDAPESLMQICPTNPSSENLKNYVSKYRNARITIPVVYPYFSSECDYEFKLSVIRSIVGALTEI